MAARSIGTKGQKLSRAEASAARSSALVHDLFLLGPGGGGARNKYTVNKVAPIVSAPIEARQPAKVGHLTWQTAGSPGSIIGRNGERASEFEDGWSSAPLGATRSGECFGRPLGAATAI